MQIDADNRWFQLASGFVNASDRHLFLTGKAGTGKTTFLHYIQQHCQKRSVILAPTGVAAINAGGVTLHSFFQLPFGPFVPSGSSGWGNMYSTPHKLISNIRFSQDKKELLKELDLLIIDEISMVRADMLDAVDLICRHFREKPNLPFGGLQVLYIGDLFQLPPVVKEEEWEPILAPHYRSPFFFDAKVIEQAPPLLIELKKIYRQDEEEFIDLLNKVRNANIDEAGLEKLNARLDRSFEPAIGESVITLTSHNAKANALNDAQLNLLRSDPFYYEAEITGDFPEKAYPAERRLCIKEGAQVMFIKNDKGEARKYYNGKLATVSRLLEDRVFVSMDDSAAEFEVEKEEWRNIRYQFNREMDSVEEEELGSFKQFPLRLAWAITIHKSQGLTFSKAVIDAGASFAPGQVYVALSRLKRLEGLVLRSYISAEAIRTDSRVLEFVNREIDATALEELLAEERQVFVRRSFLKFFSFSQLQDEASEIRKSLAHRVLPDKVDAAIWHQAWQQSIDELESIAVRFRQQLEQIVHAAEPETELKDRVEAATNYFLSALNSRKKSLKEHAEQFRLKARTKKYIQDLAGLSDRVDRQMKTIEKAGRLAFAMTKGESDSQMLALITSPLPTARDQTASEGIVSRPKKGESQKISLKLFLEGRSVAEIANERGLVAGTIESHLISFINTGELELEQFIDPGRIQHIRKEMEKLPAGDLHAKILKDRLGDTYSYNEIRAVLTADRVS